MRINENELPVKRSGCGSMRDGALLGFTVWLNTTENPIGSYRNASMAGKDPPADNQTKDRAKIWLVDDRIAHSRWRRPRSAVEDPKGPTNRSRDQRGCFCRWSVRPRDWPDRTAQPAEKEGKTDRKDDDDDDDVFSPSIRFRRNAHGHRAINTTD